MLSTHPPVSAPLETSVPGGGIIAERLRSLDWPRHPLGAPAAWPPALRSALRIMLASRQPMWLGWGRALHFFCNDACLPALGSKATMALGATSDEVWGEIWDTIEPHVRAVAQDGRADSDASLPLRLERGGHAEETYHTFSYSALVDDDGAIGGLLCVVTDDTPHVLAARRLALLRALAADLAGATTEDGWRRAIEEQLAARPPDLPFALVYLFAPDAAEARLAAAHGAAPGDPLAPEIIADGSAVQPWPARAVREKSPPVVVDDLTARFARLPAAAGDPPPRQALVVPLNVHGGARPAGFLVAGINPHRPLDADYRDFVNLVAGQLAAGLSAVRASEAEGSRAASLAELAMPSGEAPDVPGATERSSHGGKVLVVDDDPDMRRYLARLLSTQFAVTTAANGAAALELMPLEKPDLVVSDALMPQLDGVGLLTAIRSRPDLRTIPVILLSERAGEQARIAGLDAGADDYLVKPFSARELLARVNVHLQMARIRSQAEERERELRTKAEMFARALRESTERLSASLVAAGTGTFRWDIRTSALDADEALERLLGLPPGRSVRSLGEFIQRMHGDDRSRVLAAFERCSRQGADFDLELRVVRPDSAVRWLAAKARAFFNDEGRTVYMTGACVDITKRKQTETFVWRQRDVLEQIVGGAPLGDVLETITLDVEKVTERPLIAIVMLADAEGRQLRPVAGRRCPPAWKRALEGVAIAPDSITCGVAAFTKERVIVRDVATSPQWQEWRSEALRHGLRACWSTPILSLGGHVLGTFDIYYPESSAPTEEEARFVEIVARTAAIVAEREQAQRALDESRARLAEHAQNLELRVQERTAKLQETVSDLESFSYSISHDMRAPLRAMQSFAQILTEECGAQLGPDGKDYLRRIISASDRMDRLIQDVLTYSRVTRTELQLEPVALDQLVTGILETYPQFQLPLAHVEVRRPLPRVLGNEAALTQCFSNLVGNAVKFVASGVQPRVEIWAEPLPERRVRVCVRDNGIGIEPDAHEKIFRIFYQLDRSYAGTGIGLSIVRKAMERMGGSVGLASEPGQGSTFHLEIGLAE